MRPKKSLHFTTVRLITEKRVISEEVLDTPAKAVDFLDKYFRDMPREIVVSLFLDSALHPISVGIIGLGGLDSSIASTQSIFQSALLCNAKSLIIGHVHPSGRLIPSKDDIDLTKRVIACGRLLEIDVLDHIIFGPNGRRSMSMEGDVDFKMKLPFEKIVAEI